MPITFDFKLTISLIAVALTIYGYVPYFRDIFSRKTTPHLYTWLVWAITEGTATVAIWRGDGIAQWVGLFALHKIYVSWT